MLIYLFWEFLDFMCSQFKIRKKNAVIFLCSIMWLLLGFRSINMGLFDTKDVYYASYETLSRVNFGDFIRTLSIVDEPLMKIITWILSHITRNFQYYILVTSFFPIYAIGRLLLNENKDPIFGLAVYFGLYFFYGTFLIKQMLSIAIVIYSYKFLKSRNLLPFVITILVAACVHKTSIFFLLAYPACKYIKFNKYFFMIIISMMGVGIFAPDLVLNLIYKLPVFNFRNYIYHGIYSMGQGLNFSVFFYFFILMFCFCFKNKHKCSDYNDLLILSFIGCVLNSWSTIVTEFYRLALYFNVFICILVPYSIYTSEIKNRKNVRIVLLLIFYAYAYKTALNTNSIIYEPFWVN